MKKLIVTADDFGLSPEHNQGIIKSHIEGIVTSTALLINAPSTQEAIDLAKKNPSLEIGLHLAFVESYACHCPSSLNRKIRYFPEHANLPANFQEFIPRYLLQKYSLLDLEREIRSQIELFLKHFSEIPFLNGTQHLHLFPKILNIILKCHRDYPILAIRNPYSMIRLRNSYQRFIPSKVMEFLAFNAKYLLQEHSIFTTDYFSGFYEAGSLNFNDILMLLNNMPHGTTELMVHPAFHNQSLRDNKLLNYNEFNWQSELDASTNNAVLSSLKNNNILLTNFTLEA